MGLFDLLNLFRDDPRPRRRDAQGRRQPTADVDPQLYQNPIRTAARPHQPPQRPAAQQPPYRPPQPPQAAYRPPQPSQARPAPSPRPAPTHPPRPPAQPVQRRPEPAPARDALPPGVHSLADAHAQRQEVQRQAQQPARPRLVAENAGLQANNLGKRFKNRPVVRDVSLQLNRGEAVGLLGPNGAGKTTCFYMITGLISPDYGSIVLDGVDISDLPMYRRARLGIGYLPQEASIFRGLTVERNIRAVLEVVEPDPEVREMRLDELLAEFNISHLRRTPALALSGGERRRCEIARALASKPNYMLLDEPLAGIDPIAVRDIRELVAHLKDRGLGVLITDHNVREMLDIVDRAYIIHEGRVLMEGRPAEIVANQDVRRVYLGDRFSI
jgi:lipopolysaccharide export system ATP-binding protein